MSQKASFLWLRKKINPLLGCWLHRSHFVVMTSEVSTIASHFCKDKAVLELLMCIHPSLWGSTSSGISFFPRQVQNSLPQIHSHSTPLSYFKNYFDTNLLKIRKLWIYSKHLENTKRTMGGKKRKKRTMKKNGKKLISKIMNKAWILTWRKKYHRNLRNVFLPRVTCFSLSKTCSALLICLWESLLISTKTFLNLEV